MQIDFKALSPQEGDLIVVRYWEPISQQQRHDLEAAVTEAISNLMWAKGWRRMPGWLLMPDTFDLAAYDEEQMRRLGWVRVEGQKPAVQFREFL